MQGYGFVILPIVYCLTRKIICTFDSILECCKKVFTFEKNYNQSLTCSSDLQSRSTASHWSISSQICIIRTRASQYTTQTYGTSNEWTSSHCKLTNDDSSNWTSTLSLSTTNVTATGKLFQENTVKLMKIVSRLHDRDRENIINSLCRLTCSVMPVTLYIYLLYIQSV